MSEKPVNSGEKKNFGKVFKWISAILAVGILECGAIAGAVYITESKNDENNSRLSEAFGLISAQKERIDRLQKLSADISVNREKIAETAGELQLLSGNFSALKEEVGNKKIEVLSQQFSALSHRLESVEETKSQDALILSLALIIKENALYGRHFANEAAILSVLAQGQEGIKADLDTINEFSNDVIANDLELISAYKRIAEDFSFEKEVSALPEKDNDQNKSTVSKSIEIIKDTVAGINFDKVVVLKKDKKTSEQKLLLIKLSELIDNHKFNDAIDFINENPQFNDGDNPDFIQWLTKLKKKVRFDAAISHIIAFELNAIREDINNKTLTVTPDLPQPQDGD